MSLKRRFALIYDSWISLLSRVAWPIILISLLLSGLSVFYTIQHLSFLTKRTDLVASDKHLIAMKERLEREFGTKDGLVVVIASPERQRSIAFAEALATELRRYPEDFAELFYRIDPERLKSFALFYLAPAELAQLKEQLTNHRTMITQLAADPSLGSFFQGLNQEITKSMIGELFTGFLQESRGDKLPNLGLLNSVLRQFHEGLTGQREQLSFVNALLPQGFGDFQEEGYFFTQNKYLLFLVTTREGDYTVSQRALNRLRTTVAQLKVDFPEIQAGVTGPEALEDDEMTGAMQDITLATWLSLMGQVLLLIIFFRSLKRTAVEGLALIIGLCCTFGLVTLVVGHLNILSMIFTPLMLGITIDYGIHWFCRLEEEQGGAKRCGLENLSSAQRHAAPGIVYAALAAAVSFLPLLFTGFKGLAELGLILFMGIIVMLLVTLVVQPALVIVVERCKTGDQGPEPQGKPHPFSFLRGQRPGIVLTLVLGLAALGVISLLKVPFDLNPLNLQNSQTESVVWELKLLEGSRYSSVYGIMTANSLKELQAKTKALKGLSSVSRVESILSFLPDDPQEKLPMIRELRPLTQVNISAAPISVSAAEDLADILGRIKFKMSQAQKDLGKSEDDGARKQLQDVNLLLSQILPLLDPVQHPQVSSRLSALEKQFCVDLTEKWHLLKANLDADLPGIANLPSPVRQRFVSPTGIFIMQIFPSADIWDLDNLKHFVQDLRKIDPNVVGDPVMLYVFNSAFRNACVWAAGIALLAITFMLLLFFRNLKLSLLALTPLLVGTGWTLNLMWLLDISFNQANVLFLPLILGEGAEFGIIILTRWQLEKSARAMTLPASTAKGVALAALTTTAGFGSLMVSGHRGVFSLGLLAAVGSLSVLLAALTILPALLRVLEDQKARSTPFLKPLFGWEPWAYQTLKKRKDG